MTDRSNRLARNLLKNRATSGDKIAFYMRNRPEYLEGLAAAFKARLTHVNVNYRYIENELLYLLDNADATTCIFSGEFIDHVEKIRGQLPGVTQWVQVDDGFPLMDGAIAFEDYATKGDANALDIKGFAEAQLLTSA